MSLVVAQPANVRALFDAAVAAGATVLKPVEKSMWGLGGIVQAPDGAIWNLATSAKKDSGPATKDFDNIVLLLGADDVGASKRFYVDRGLAVAKSFGSYVDFATPSSPIGLGTLQAPCARQVRGYRGRRLRLAPHPGQQRCRFVHRPRRVRLGSYAVAVAIEPTPSAINRLSTASTDQTGVITFRSGFDREIAFMKMPRVKYPKITHIATTEKGSGNTSIAPSRSNAMTTINA